MIEKKYASRSWLRELALDPQLKTCGIYTNHGFEFDGSRETEHKGASLGFSMLGSSRCAVCAMTATRDHSSFLD